MLRIRDIRSGYGSLEILHGVSCSAEKGEIVAILGPNGMGKSTLVKTITGLLPCKSGEIVFEDKNITHLSAIERVKSGIAQVPERRRIFNPLTVKENLSLGMYANYRRLGRRGRTEAMDYVYELFPILKERAGQLGGMMSGGEQQMLAIARGLVMKPRLMILDEPCLGLAPLIVKSIAEILGDLNHSGLTVMIVEQNVKAILRMAQRLYLMGIGIIEKEIDITHPESEQEIIAFYRGEKN